MVERENKVLGSARHGHQRVTEELSGFWRHCFERREAKQSDLSQLAANERLRESLGERLHFGEFRHFYILLWFANPTVCVSGKEARNQHGGNAQCGRPLWFIAREGVKEEWRRSHTLESVRQDPRKWAKLTR